MWGVGNLLKVIKKRKLTVNVMLRKIYKLFNLLENEGNFFACNNGIIAMFKLSLSYTPG